MLAEGCQLPDAARQHGHVGALQGVGVRGHMTVAKAHLCRLCTEQRREVRFHERHVAVCGGGASTLNGRARQGVVQCILSEIRRTAQRTHYSAAARLGCMRAALLSLRIALPCPLAQPDMPHLPRSTSEVVKYYTVYYSRCHSNARPAWHTTKVRKWWRRAG